MRTKSGNLNSASPVNVHAMSNAQIERWKLARLRGRTDLLYLCREILGYKDVSPVSHAPILQTLQKFPKPTREQFAANDNLDLKTGKWSYSPILPMTQLPGKRRRLILDPRGHLKCLRFDTLVNKTDGSYVPAREIRVGDELWGIDENTYSPKKTKVLGVEVQDPQPCVQIEFRSGRKVEVSENHPIRMIDGWTLAEALRPGDRVAILNHRPVNEGGKSLPEAAFLGYMVGDGNCAGRNFTNTDPKFREKFAESVFRIDGTCNPHKNQPSCKVSTQRCSDVLRKHGLLNATSGNKFVPSAVFSADDESVKDFLYAYLMCDGTLQKHTGISWTSKSERLANDIRRLFGRFGISARVLPVTLKTGPYAGNKYYYGYVSGSKEIKKVLSLFPWDKPHTWVPSVENPNLDTVPREWRKLYPKNFFRRGSRPEWFSKKWKQKSLSKYGGRKEKLYDLGVALGDERLQNLGSDKIFWDEVKKVTKIGNHPTIAIETDTENFCVDDVVTHNTTINVQAHTIQWILNYPSIAIQIVQSNTEKAEAIIREIRQHFQYNPVFRDIYPDLVPTKKIEDFGNSSQFTTPGRPPEVIRREPTVMAGSIDKGSAGYHFDVIKFSDIVEPNNVRTPEQIQAVISSFWLAENLLVAPQYWIDVEGTRYDFSDLYGRIIEIWHEDQKLGKEPVWEIMVRSCWQRDFGDKEPYYHPGNLELPFKTDENGNKIPVWPERFRREDLERLEKQDAYIFSCQQLNNPSVMESDRPIFPVNREFPKFIKRDVYEKNIPIAFREIAVDTAETVSDRSDFTVITVGAWSGNNRLYVEEIVRGKFLPDEIIRKLILLYTKYQNRVTPIRSVKIEETGFVRGLNVSLERECARLSIAMPIHFLKRESRDSKKDRIIKTLQPGYRAGEIIFLDDISCKEALIHELSRFPLYKHDDILDTLSDLYQGKEEFGRLLARPRFEQAQKDAWDRMILGQSQPDMPLADDDFSRIGWT